WSLNVDVQHERFTPQELEIKPDAAKNGEVVLQALLPARHIQGDVVCEDTGKPVPDARLIVSARPSENELNSTHWTASRADHEGRFRIAAPVGAFITVIAYPPAGTPYLVQSKSLDWSKGNVIKREI